MGEGGTMTTAPGSSKRRTRSAVLTAALVLGVCLGVVASEKLYLLTQESDMPAEALAAARSVARSRKLELRLGAGAAAEGAGAAAAVGAAAAAGGAVLRSSGGEPRSELERVLREVAPQGEVMIAISNYNLIREGSLRMWLQCVQKLDATNWLVVAIDEELRDYCKDSDVEGMSDGYDEPTAYGEIYGVDDASMGWSRYAQGARHMAFNSGLFYVRASERTIDLMRRIAAKLRAEKAWDQSVWNEFIFFLSHGDYRSPQVVARVMDIYQFMNSKVLFKRVRHMPKSQQPRPVMVHMNYHPNKGERMAAAIKYYLEGDEHALDPFPGGSEPEMARHLHAYLSSGGAAEPLAGGTLLAYNRSAGKATALASQLSGGAAAADSPAALAGCRLTFCMLSNDEAVEAVLSSYLEGALAAPAPGGASGDPAAPLFVDCSTVLPATSARLAVRAAARGVGYLACPVFGRPDAAEKGLLIGVVSGGTKAQRELVKSAAGGSFAGRRVIDLGAELGAAHAMKLSGNFWIVSQIAVASEVLALAEKNGVLPDVMVSLLDGMSQAGIPMGYTRRIAAGDYSTETGFAVDLALKDVGHIRSLGRDSACPVPLADLAFNNLLSRKAKGQGALDWGAIALSVRDAAGLPSNAKEPTAEACTSEWARAG
eukprot:scaffold4.g4607.t1